MRKGPLADAVVAKGADEKTGLHPRNRHRGRYDFDRLIAANPELAKHVRPNAYQEISIDFADPQAVRALNRALLKHAYDIADWEIPARYLCPPIPGRADYVHYLADLMAQSNGDVVPQGPGIRVLDVGVGANLVYPLIGHREYGWHFVGAEIDSVAVANAQRILEANAGLATAIELRLQKVPDAMFNGVIGQGECFDLTLCNPPFHGSLDEANAGSRRKWQNLGKGAARSQKPVLNFGGQGAELVYPGGEEAFIQRMISESAQFKTQCHWFTTLVSKASSLPAIYRALRGAGAFKINTIEMTQGQKKSRFVAWTFLNAGQQQAWRLQRWKNATRI